MDVYYVAGKMWYRQHGPRSAAPWSKNTPDALHLPPNSESAVKIYQTQ